MMTRCSFMGQLQNPSILGDPHPYQLQKHCLSSEASWPNIAAHQPSKPNIRWFQLGFITVKTRAMPQRRHYYPNPLEITKRTYGSIYHKKKALWKWLLCCVQSGLTAAFVMETCQKQPLLLCSCVIPVILRLLQFVLLSYSLAKIALYVYNLACAFSKPIHLLMVSGVFLSFCQTTPRCL